MQLSKASLVVPVWVHDFCFLCKFSYIFIFFFRYLVIWLVPLRIVSFLTLFVKHNWIEQERCGSQTKLHLTQQLRFVIMSNGIYLCWRLASVSHFFRLLEFNLNYVAVIKSLTALGITNFWSLVWEAIQFSLSLSFSHTRFLDKKKKKSTATNWTK